jgi:hypothetical protein
LGWPAVEGTGGVHSARPRKVAGGGGFLRRDSMPTIRERPSGELDAAVGGARLESEAEAARALQARWRCIYRARGARLAWRARHGRRGVEAPDSGGVLAAAGASCWLGPDGLRTGRSMLRWVGRIGSGRLGRGGKNA